MSKWSKKMHLAKRMKKFFERKKVPNLDAMVNAYEEERAKYVGGVVYYPNNQEAFKGAMRKALAIRGVKGE